MYLDNEFHKLLAQSTSPRILPRMHPIMELLNSQIKRAQLRQSVYNQYSTTGFRLLCNIIDLGMSDELAKYDTDIDRLFNVLNLQRIYLTRTFDSSGGGGKVHSKYFIGNPSCHEYIFSVVPRSPTSMYPLDKGPSAWKKYRPFRLIDHDSSDQTLNINGGHLLFKRNIPHFALYTFDPVAAILQFCNLQDEVSLEQYVHQYLIMPALTLDNQRLWLMGVYSEWFSSRSRSYVDIPMVTTDYSHIPTNLDKALQEIGSMIDSSRSGNVGVQRLLSSLPLPYKTTIPQYATTLYNRSSVDDVTEYDWGTFMIYRRMLDIAVRALSVTINSRDSQADIYRLRRAVDLMSAGRIGAPIHDSYTKMFVKQSINALQMQTTNLYDRVRSA